MDERVALKTGTIIDKKYTILSELGRGGSCIVYEAIYEDKSGFYHKVRIKELYPYKLKTIRKNDLCITCNDINAMELYKKSFYQAYSENLRFFEDPELINSTVEARDIFEENNTVYSVFSCDGGTTYDKYTPASMKECVGITLSIAKAIKRYHDLGYLHLDIKPSNVFIMDGVKNHVILFDFDTICSLSDIENGIVNKISYSEGFAAPEQINGSINKIGKHTDIFAIGAILYFKVFGKPPSVETRRHDYIFNIEECEYYDDRYDSELVTDFTTIIRNTMSSNIRLRYHDIQDLIDLLEIIEKEAELHKQVLKHTPIIFDSYVVGRTEELKTIAHLIEREGKLVLSGMGGVGKTTLAKEYARRYRDKYSKIIFLPARNDFVDVIADDINLTITNFLKFENESIEAYAQRKLSKLKNICDKSTLFIVDSLDGEIHNKDLFRDFLLIDCNMLITSRLRDWSIPCLDIGVIDDDNDLLKLFKHYCNYNEGEKQYVIEAINRMDKLTVAVELIAKQASASHLTPKELMTKIDTALLDNIGTEQIEGTDSLSRLCTLKDNLRALYRYEDLNKIQRKILLLIALMPQTGIEDGILKRLGELDNYSEVNCLEKSGWIKFEVRKYVMHPIIAETILICHYKSDTLDNIIRRTEVLFDDYQIQPYRMKTTIEEISSCMIKKLIKLKYESPELFRFIADYGMKYYSERRYSEFENMCLEYAENCNKLDAHSLFYIRAYHADALAAKGSIDEALDISNKLYGMLDSFDDNYERKVNRAYYFSLRSLIHKIAGDFIEALSEIKESIKLLEDAGYNAHRKLILQKIRLINLYLKMGESKLAESCCTEVIEMCNQKLDTNDRLLVTLYEKLAILYSRINVYPKAEKYSKKCLELFLFHYGKDHEYFPYFCNLIAHSEQNQERYIEAEKYLDDAEDYENNHETNADMYSHTLLLKGLNLYRLGKYSNALYYANAARDYSDNYTTKNIARRIACRDLRANIFIKLGDYYRAIEEKESSYYIAKNLEKKDNRLILMTLIGIGQACKKIDYYRAKLSYKAALKIIEDSNYSDIRENFVIHENLGVLYDFYGEYDKAEIEYSTAWQIYKELGMDNSYYLSSLSKDIRLLELHMGKNLGIMNEIGYSLEKTVD